MITAASPRVCVIGAGCSGLAVAKALGDRRITFDCFEKADRVGGLWAFGARSSESPAYRSLRINSSRNRSGFRDFPMPRDYPDFPHHTQIADYFNAYADRFGLRRHIHLNTEVVCATRQPTGGWEIALATGERRFYSVLIVANGHHREPLWPDPPMHTAFTGAVMHAHRYRDPADPLDLRAKRVVVVGLGNTAVDIASELSAPGVAGQVWLSTRRGGWILPKRAFGRPLDRLPGTWPWMPWRLQSWILNAVVRATHGVPWRVGLPRPDHSILAAHPTLSDTVMERLCAGAIIPKPALTALSGEAATFADGSSVAADVVIYCTGYRISFPFFPLDFISAPDNELPLWRRMVRPGLPDLFFVGLLQPLGALMPLVEAQARLIADALTGDYVLPSKRRMQAEIERERYARKKRYVASPRHTMQVDFDRYFRDLEREHRRGRGRWRRR